MTDPMPSIDPDDLDPGTSLMGGRFQISARLGQGGTASVYLAYGERGRAYAIKLIHTGSGELPNEERRFRNEMRLAPLLRSIPGVLAPLEGAPIPELPGEHGIVYDYVRGPTLARFLAANRLTVLHACRLVRNIADTLAQLHEHGVVHRDVKPGNIIYAQDGTRPRLIEYGFAWSTLTEDTFVPAPGLEHAHARPGTKRYMAPEQALGKHPAGSFDIYALAVTLFEALTGRIPWDGFDDNEILRRKCDPTEPEPTVRSQRRDLPAALVDLIDGGLRRDPAERISTMEAFRDRIDAILTELGDALPSAHPAPAGSGTGHRVIATKPGAPHYSPASLEWTADDELEFRELDFDDDEVQGVPQGHLVHRRVEALPRYRMTPGDGVEMRPRPRQETTFNPVAQLDFDLDPLSDVEAEPGVAANADARRPELVPEERPDAPASPDSSAAATRSQAAPTPAPLSITRRPAAHGPTVAPIPAAHEGFTRAPISAEPGPTRGTPAGPPVASPDASATRETAVASHARLPLESLEPAVAPTPGSREATSQPAAQEAAPSFISHETPHPPVPASREASPPPATHPAAPQPVAHGSTAPSPAPSSEPPVPAPIAAALVPPASEPASPPHDDASANEPIESVTPRDPTSHFGDVSPVPLLALDVESDEAMTPRPATQTEPSSQGTTPPISLAAELDRNALDRARAMTVRAPSLQRTMVAPTIPMSRPRSPRLVWVGAALGLLVILGGATTVLRSTSTDDRELVSLAAVDATPDGVPPNEALRDEPAANDGATPPEPSPAADDAAVPPEREDADDAEVLAIVPERTAETPEAAPEDPIADAAIVPTVPERRSNDTPRARRARSSAPSPVAAVVLPPPPPDPVPSPEPAAPAPSPAESPSEGSSNPKSADCEEVRSGAQNAWIRRDWGGVLRLVRKQNCWSSKAERLRLEVVALDGLKLYHRCVDVGQSSDDLEVLRTVEVCRAKSSP